MMHIPGKIARKITPNLLAAAFMGPAFVIFSVISITNAHATPIFSTSVFSDAALTVPESHATINAANDDHFPWAQYSTRLSDASYTDSHFISTHIKAFPSDHLVAYNILVPMISDRVRAILNEATIKPREAKAVLPGTLPLIFSALFGLGLAFQNRTRIPR